jgi:hypothetical protein
VSWIEQAGRDGDVYRLVRQYALDVLHEPLDPGMFLLPVVDGEQGLLPEEAKRDPRSASASSISPSVMPDASSVVTTSLRHPAVSVAAIRRRLSPQIRSHRSMPSGRNPFASGR